MANYFPAFPCTTSEPNERGVFYPVSHPGMTLRDWFAGQWIAAGHHANLLPDEAAEAAYEHADAMLLERMK